MKKIIITIGVLVSGAAYSQVGIDTETPKATLDVKGKPSDVTKADGIIAPRLKGSELKSKDALYTADQKASLVYVTEALASADTTAKTINVTSVGYFYFDGSVWQKLNAGNTGSTGIEPWYNEATNQPADSNTQNIYQMGKVGVGVGVSPTSPYQFQVGTYAADNETTLKAGILNSVTNTGSGASIGIDNTVTENSTSTTTGGVTQGIRSSVMDSSKKPHTGIGADISYNVSASRASSTPSLQGIRSTAQVRPLDGDFTTGVLYGVNALTSGVAEKGNLTFDEDRAYNGVAAPFANSGFTYNSGQVFGLHASVRPGGNGTVNIGNLYGASGRFEPTGLKSGGVLNVTGLAAGLDSSINFGSTGTYNIKKLMGLYIHRLQPTSASYNIENAYGIYISDFRFQGNNPENAYNIYSEGADTKNYFGGNVGIGTTTPSTKLEINNGTTNGAIKIVDGTQGAGKVLTSDANGLATWQDSATGMGNNWSILGNSGTTAGTNFIGTTDAVDFVLKTNNTERERTYKSTNANNIIKEIKGGDLNLNGLTIGRGKGDQPTNTIVGQKSLDGNTTGKNNVALGYYAINSNTTGSSNVSVGHSSLSSNTEGNYNTALGQSTLTFNTTGTNNVAIGASALSSPDNTTGNKNIGIGVSAGNGLKDGASNNIAIGSDQRLKNDTDSNQLNIGGAIFGTGLTGSAAAPAGNIGIGTATPSTKLEVNNGTTNGAIKIVDGTQGEGKVLTSDANGVGTWRVSASSRSTTLGVFPATNITTYSDLPTLNTVGTDPSDPQKYTGAYIDLEPGKWVVNSGMTIYCFKANLTHFQHAYLSNSQTSVVQNDFQNLGPGAYAAFAGKISNGSIEGIDADPQRNANFLTGSSVISVTQPTRIYLLLENKPDLYWSYSTSAWENYFYAVPVN
ncbi:beta strand repeat-containing protein [Chryseobacterium sp. YIM B08800]|uniref:beta strand repeat-containing protein n=1 Tax=Chryseobacterium sp. YIM B08800 TaxID=2984136 RepID=UPI00223F1AA3|nr:hypothetical protein [Chryseobacterium sp. YIM B08800]